MADTVRPRRLTDLLPGKAAAWLLALLWIAGMSAFDTNACTAFPLVVGLGVVAALTLSSLSYGGRTVRLTWVSWVSLGIGGYYLVRCLNSYALVESWRESELIVGGCAFYVAGIYAAQGRNLRFVAFVLALSLVLNIAAFFLLQNGLLPIEWTGRPAWGFSGQNSVPITLFQYKNFAGDFLCICGLAAVWTAVWLQTHYAVRTAWLLLGASAVALSFCCQTRGVYVLLPVLVGVAWVLHLINSLYKGNRMGWGTWLVGGVLCLGVIVSVCEFLFSGESYVRLLSTDTHLRSMAWRGICDEAPSAPLWGYGTSASHWDTIVHFNEWSTPNLAHNEYLQVWMDYGLLGVAGMLFVLFAHFICGFRRLASEHISPGFRLLVSVSVLILLGMAVCAVADFPWHQFALVGMTAFACGVTASPYPHCGKGDGDAPRPVRVQGRPGRGLIALLCCVLVAYSCMMGKRLYEPWRAQWEFSTLLKQPEINEPARLALLERVLYQYPDPSLMDRYYMFPLRTPDWEKQEQLLRVALSGNPHQLYTAAMLADILTRHGKYAESEALLRRCYIGDGMDSTMMINWPAIYAVNLLRWGRSEMKRGNEGKAYSLLDYGLNVATHGHSGLSLTLLYCSNAPWCRTRSYRADVKRLEKLSTTDCALLKLLQVEKDDSWLAPQYPGGKPALYAEWGKDSSKRKKINLTKYKLPKKTEKKAN